MAVLRITETIYLYDTEYLLNSSSLNRCLLFCRTGHIILTSADVEQLPPRDPDQGLIEPLFMWDYTELPGCIDSLSCCRNRSAIGVNVW